ncbi:cytochrome B [Haloferax mediterranei ATCC 33500]|uniref:Cytochrome B n=1 Tax=Haloferax mediterranei (strain ATCC 33500 / DSM 1411 / JCM 8866 / NBRC 14739 / NCIMB 2177 / R-4) TaxID=523841 RepID=I3R6L7_HALMT|nr:cbb3-type cytochrome c oxidase subunit I [Haloferax mediterranei]AFK19877.1 cytochrome b subunit of nitric oxide reductase [Haloferax mediterranei ATCC 33500]AHZ23256.1 cytochrome B [Haloferax mediterranei ATCC 33500]ELZ99421.1 cytochrome b subunit of nitric oxide reductase [Haloferax mediterranei ATCC 33500]MDX5987374.1 cbb3-type cytochrome c oxidase subunit I [Haloferax mediterranei ATCC 33500]QCQ73882.1 cytochrome B [Haloferax mediterranei ATCC 33500]
MELKRKTIAKVIAVVFIFNLVVMGAGAWFAYQEAPPIPEKVVGPDGEVIVNGEEIRDGKKVFQQNGLMNHGSILGNGAYYGVDYTADALELKVQYMRDYYAQERHGESYSALDSATQAAIADVVEKDLDGTYEGGAIEYSEAERYAHEQVRQEYVQRYHEGDHERGVPVGMIDSEAEAEQFADFAMWTAWFSHTDRPGSTHSYTNDWPYQPGAGNDATAASMTWSVIAMVLLVAGAGLGIWLYKSVELPEPSAEGISVPEPGEVSIFPSQRAALRFIPVAAGLFVAQVLLGGLLAHFYIERAGFFGIETLFGIHILQLLPFSIAKTWHIDLAILWIAATWLGAGLFLPPLLTGYEPRKQSTYINGLLGAIVVVTLGGLGGIWLGANGYIDGPLWWILGNEGLEYLEVGKLWQFGILAGFLIWAGLAVRGLKPLLDKEPVYGLAHMILYAGGSIALLFTAGFLFTPDTNIAVTEFWRWWVVHMWVEGAFEFFIVAIVGLTLVSMNLLSRRSAEKAVMLQALLVMGTGIIGVSHHYWWVGMPDMWVPLGSVFSTLELIPLVFILYEALGQYRTMSTGENFPYRLPFMFIIASGVWNFVGAGVLGFFINLPLINYYEHGTYLTVGHAHAAMFGAFGFLALGMVTYMLQLSIDPARWDGSWLRAAFWCWNVGLVLMVFVSVLPVGFLQLETAFTGSYAAARSLAFYNQPIIQTLFWARLPGDTLMILGTVIYAADLVRKRFVLRESSDDPSVEDMAVAEGILGDD